MRRTAVGADRRRSTRRDPRTGLGLYISRQLVELNGGRVWMTSAGAGRGAAFHFTLAAAPPGR
jgi:signal transduction histidine kinase